MSPHCPPISFEKFMERALYDPRNGYYSRRITGVGHRGDFSTSPMLSDAPAEAIAAWATAALKECHTGNLIEIGPGEGKLAADVRSRLPWLLRRRLRLHLVERSAPLRERQKQALGGKARWHETISSALAACSNEAVIYSNELVDAFPVRRFEMTPDGWRELLVEFPADGNAIESLAQPAPLPSSSSFSISHPVGQRIEVHASYKHWLESWMPHWKAGRMLTIDYGATADQIYHRRPAGSLRAYLYQQRLEGPQIYQNPGRQDLTADVNFTDLVNWSEPWMDESKLQTFQQFLQPGINPESAVDRKLADPMGAGGAFLVLDQKRQDAKKP